MSTQGVATAIKTCSTVIYDADKVTFREESDFKNLLPRQDDGVIQQLKDNIIADGCREPLVVANYEGKSVLIDGYTRLQICRQEGLAYKVILKDFSSKPDAMSWAIENQIGQRSLSVQQRIRLVLQNEELFKEAAKLRMQRKDSASPDLGEQKGKSSELMAKVANTSASTMENALSVVRKGCPKLREMLFSGELSVDAANVLAKEPIDEQEKILSQDKDKRTKSISEIRSKYKKFVPLVSYRNLRRELESYKLHMTKSKSLNNEEKEVYGIARVLLRRIIRPRKFFSGEFTLDLHPDFVRIEPLVDHDFFNMKVYINTW